MYRSSISPKNGMKSGIRSIGMTMYAIAPDHEQLVDDRHALVGDQAAEQPHILRQLPDVVHHRALGAGARCCRPPGSSFRRGAATSPIAARVHVSPSELLS